VNSVVSVSIVAETCAFADGLATAVMVMGREKGLKLINDLPGIEGMIVVRQAGSQLMDYPSIGFMVKAEP
ncbi:MAG: hypothetical protein HKO79_09430, partial [Desulfobacterales bacterium]|nr:hypothetical protein [Desulfobacterales bacterium]